MDLLNATTHLAETINKLTLWNKDSTNLKHFEILNQAIRNKKQSTIDQIFNSIFSNELSDYDILNKAAEYGYTDVADFMLKKGCKVNCLSFIPSMTPLHNAVKWGDAQMVEKLLNKGASVVAVDVIRDSPLHLAFHGAFISQDNEIVDLILTHIEKTSSYINVKNQHGLSHLHIASARGNAKVVSQFIQAGANLLDFIYDDSPTHAGYTVLQFACDAKALDVIKICRQIFPNVIQIINTYVHENINQDNSLDILEWLDNSYKYLIKLHHKCAKKQLSEELKCNELSDFHLACLEGDLDSVKSFLDNGEDVNTSMSQNAEHTPLYTALHFALESEHQRFEKVKLLLDHDADVYKRNGFCMTALHLAMYTHNWEKTSPSSVELLYTFVKDKKANPMDCNGLTYFHIAVAANDMDLVRQFLDAGEDPNQVLLNNFRGYQNFRPLHFAVKYNRVEMAKLLIDRGADVNPKEGQSPLQIALKFGYYRLIDLLLAHNANVKVIKSNKKMTTLHLLVEYYIEESCNFEKALKEKKELIRYVEKLVSLGVNVNAKDIDGFTALHIACLNIHNGIWLVERLLAVGADINLKNDEGETPLDVVLRRSQRATYDDILLLYHHVQRLKALGLYVDVKNKEFCIAVMEMKEEWKNNKNWKIIEDMCSDETFSRKKKERFDEIEKLKRDMITEDVSLYDYLRMDPEQASAYNDNKRIKKIVEGEAEVRYKVYGYLIPVQYLNSLDWN